MVLTVMAPSNAPSAKGSCVMDPQCKDSRPLAMSRAVSPCGLAEHRLRHLDTMNTGRRTDTVKQEFQPHAATESDIGHRPCFIGLQRPRGGAHEAPVAPIERRTNQPSTQTARMTELLSNT